jgi:hypothetical protein
LHVAVSPRNSAAKTYVSGVWGTVVKETVCSGNIFHHDSTHASKYDVITASACLLGERWRQVIEVYGLSDRVTVFSYVAGLLQISIS